MTTKQVAHTEGPWTARESSLSRNRDLWFINTASGWRVGGASNEADARLIAAAPTMYQELELAADTFRDISNVLQLIAAVGIAERHIREQLAVISGK